MDSPSASTGIQRWPFQTGSAASTWSIPATPLIGRTTKLNEIVGRLSDPATRLLTLTGPGGVGKTRLAMASLERLIDAFQGRAYFVPLAAVNDPSLVPNTIAWALTSREPGSIPPLAAITRALGSESSLLVLDNFEHVMPAARFVVELLSASPATRILVTSRETLRLRIEQSIVVPPLTVPGDSSLDDPDSGVTDAMTFFIECVRTIRPGYIPTDDDLVVIGAICRRLDGLPLAIELAAARTRALTPRAMLGRLDAGLQVLSHGPRDLPERQRTMRSAIIWSWDLLHEQDRAIFRRLSVFAGTFTLDATEVVLGNNDPQSALSGIEPAMVLDGISSLLDKNLLHERVSASGEQRFSMLQTIRELALEELEASGEASAMRASHARWCLQRAAACWRGIYRDEFDTSWFASLGDEHYDFRAALAWFERKRDGPRMLQLAVDLAPFWFFHSHRIAGLVWIERAQSLFTATEISKSMRAQMTHCIGLLLHGKESALEPLSESIRLYAELDDKWGVGASSISSAVTLNALGRHQEAKGYADKAIECFQGMDEVWLGSSSMELGIALLGLGRFAEARTYLETEIAIGREIGDWFGFGQAANALCLLSIDMKDVAAARTALIDAIESWEKLGMLEGVVSSLCGAAVLASSLGEFETAAKLLGASQNVAERIEYMNSSIESVRHLATEQKCSSALKSEFLAAYTSGCAMPVRDAIALALNVGTTFASPVANFAPEQARPDGLTPREVDVIRLLAEGSSDREIGDALFITRATAARHIANIFAKINVNTRTAAAAYAFRHGLIGRSDGAR